MYNPLLKTFVEVASKGSFSKASETLFISPTAIMKQINSLENELGLKLIKRSPTGISLTRAGESIYDDAKYLMDYSLKAIAKARQKEESYETTFCVGTSILNPAKPFMDIWYKVNKDFPSYKLHLVPFDDNHENILTEIKLLNEKYDFIVGINDSKIWNKHCLFLPLGRYKKMIAVSKDDSLASKKKINLEELNGRTLMMVPRGDSPTNDRIRDELESNYPDIKIEDTTLNYDMGVFNKACEERKVLLIASCWQDVHPGLVSIDVNWSFSIPYGILYSKDAPSDVIKFVNEVKKMVGKK